MTNDLAHTRLTRAAYVLLLPLIIGCDNRDTAPTHPYTSDPRLATVTDVAGPDVPILPRFTISLDVDGSLKPGSPIHLSIRGEAHFNTRDAEIRLVLPEVAAAERSNWTAVEVPLGEKVPALLEVHRSLAAGEQFRGRATLSIPEPGFYSVLAVVSQHSNDDDTDGSHVVGAVSSRELWLWIDEHGGTVTERFEPALFPPGTRRIRGPRASERQLPRLHDGAGDISIMCTVTPDTVITLQSYDCPSTPPSIEEPLPPPPTGPGAQASITATYTDHGSGGTVRPLPDAHVTWKVIDTGTKTVVATGAGMTNANGVSPVIDCKGPTTTRELQVAVRTANDKANVQNYILPQTDNATAGRYVGSCGGSIPVAVTSEQAQLFVNLNKTWDGHLARFGLAPPAIIQAGLYPLDSYGTRYDYTKPDLHVIPAYPDNIWGEFGRFVAAHEYGHLWQDKYLYIGADHNGLMRYYSNACPNPHPVGNPTTLACAFGEAFADWYAVIVRDGDVPTWKKDLEDNTYHLFRCQQNCGADGSIVQGAVGALLYDITDADYNEAQDRVSVKPADLVVAIKTCRVSKDYSSYSSYTGIDHVIWCLEERYPYQVRMITGSGEQVVNFFTMRSSPFPLSANAVSPANLILSNDFRRLWLWDLYSKRSEVGSNPAFRSLLPEEDPTFQPPASDSTCGSQFECPQ